MPWRPERGRIREFLVLFRPVFSPWYDVQILSLSSPGVHSATLRLRNEHHVERYSAA